MFSSRYLQILCFALTYQLASADGGRGDITVTPTQPIQHRELSIQNFNPDAEPCRLKIIGRFSQCDDTSCQIEPPPRKSSLSALKINFSCLPNTAPTEFDNPAPGAKIYKLKISNSQGLYGFWSNENSADMNIEKPVKNLSFCLLYPDSSMKLCGNADVFVLSDGIKSNMTKETLNIIKNIELITKKN